MKVRIMIGLPASGKTCFAKQLKDKLNYRATYIGENELQLSFLEKGLHSAKRTPPMNDERICDYVYHEVKRKTSETVLVDGLFLTTTRVEMLIENILAANKEASITLDVWNEDRDQCEINDLGRRRVGSSLSIRELPYDVDIQYLKNKYNVTVEHHTVYVVPEYVLFFRDKLYLEDDETVLCSPTWLVSGTSHDCYGNYSVMDPDQPPTEFEALNNMLTELGVSLGTYRKIMNEAVSIQEKTSSDYYSKMVHQYYQADLRIIYAILEEDGYIHSYNSGKELRVYIQGDSVSIEGIHGEEKKTFCIKKEEYQIIKPFLINFIEQED